MTKDKIHKIALVNPFQITTKGYDTNSVKNKGQLAEPPLGLGYISAYISKFGYEVKIYDAHIKAIKGITEGLYANYKDAEDDLLREISEFKPDVVGISCLFHYISKIVHGLSYKIKKQNPNVQIVLGGSYPTGSPKAALSDSNIDFVVLGEGERTFLDILEYLNGRYDFKYIRSFGCRRNGRVIVRKGINEVKTFDDVPIPDRSNFKLSDYYRYGRHFIQKFEEYEGKELKITTITATRGCVFNCSFCIDRKIWGCGLRTRDSKNVLDEIEYLHKEHGIVYFAFNDDNLIIKRSFAKELLNGIIKRKLNIRWTTGGLSVRGLDKEIIGLMLESGCLVFNIAIESGCEETLRKINKPLRLEEVYKVVQLIKKNRKAYLMSLFMLGFPEETEEQFMMTIKMGKELGSDWTLYSCVTPFPGSDLYEEARRKRMLPPNIEDNYERLSFRNYILKPRYLKPEFVEKESYFANLDQNFINNPNIGVDGKIDIAMSDIKNVLKSAPNHAAAYYALGKIYERKNDWKKARACYLEAKKNLSGIYLDYFRREQIKFPDLSINN